MCFIVNSANSCLGYNGAQAGPRGDFTVLTSKETVKQWPGLQTTPSSPVSTPEAPTSGFPVTQPMCSLFRGHSGGLCYLLTKRPKAVVRGRALLTPDHQAHRS